MARDAVVPAADALFADFVAPLVLGGDVTPGAPLGARLGVRLHEATSLADPELISRVALARVRVARRLAPVDRVDPLPTAAEWRLLAALHDVVQATHPDLDALGRRGTAKRLLALAKVLVERAGAPATVRDALSRHTLLSRMFEITRTDVELAWWTGRARFRGTTPPARLEAWPELRRVRRTTDERGLLELGGPGAAVSAAEVTAVAAAIVEASPLTDAATAARTEPAFALSPALLALAGAPNGRRLLVRALHEGPAAAVDRALGRALGRLLAGAPAAHVAPALELVGDRALARAAGGGARAGGPKASPTARGARTREDDEARLVADDPSDPASVAVGVGAHVARRRLAEHGDAFTEAERRALLERLAPAAEAAERHGFAR